MNYALCLLSHIIKNLKSLVSLKKRKSNMQHLKWKNLKELQSKQMLSVSLSVSLSLSFSICVMRSNGRIVYLLPGHASFCALLCMQVFVTGSVVETVLTTLVFMEPFAWLY